MDFLTIVAKNAFIHLQKAFIKAPILYYFDIKPYICYETDASGYTISRVLNQITLDQHFSNYVIYKGSDFSKFKISQ